MPYQLEQMPLQLRGNLPGLQRVPGGQPFLLLLLPLCCREEQSLAEAGTDTFSIGSGCFPDLCRHQAAVAQQRIHTGAKIHPRFLFKPLKPDTFFRTFLKLLLHIALLDCTRFLQQMLPFLPLLFPVSGQNCICSVI
ncbi:hypothetical protein D3C76_723650 [compost metagenome]